VLVFSAPHPGSKDLEDSLSLVKLMGLVMSVKSFWNWLIPPQLTGW